MKHADLLRESAQFPRNQVEMFSAAGQNDIQSEQKAGANLVADANAGSEKEFTRGLGERSCVGLRLNPIKSSEG